MAIELLAASALALIAPYLVKAGEAAAEKIGEGTAEAAGKVLGWLRAKLTGRAKEALDELEAAPGDADNQADLRKQLTKALEADPGLAEELRAMIPQEVMERVTLNQTISGSNVKAAQVAGSNNDVKIG